MNKIEDHNKIINKYYKKELEEWDYSRITLIPIFTNLENAKYLSVLRDGAKNIEIETLSLKKMKKNWRIEDCLMQDTQDFLDNIDLYREDIKKELEIIKALYL